MAKNLKIRVTRVSTRPNQYGSYAYRIEKASEQTVQQLVDDENVEGTYNSEEGGMLIYSRNRVGKLNQPVSVDARIATQRDTGRKFLNLIDNSTEALGEAGYQFQQAQAYGDAFANIVGNHAVAAMFAGKSAATAAPVRAAAAGAGAGAAAGAAGEQEEEETLQEETPQAQLEGAAAGEAKGEE